MDNDAGGHVSGSDDEGPDLGASAVAISDRGDSIQIEPPTDRHWTAAGSTALILNDLFASLTGPNDSGDPATAPDEVSMM